MERKHSWTWLPSRLNNMQPPHPASAPPKRRPPLAALEQLEDRVLLSASSGGGGGTDAILIGLIKQQLDLRTSTVNFLKIVEGLDTGTQAQADALYKITTDFLKIDAAVYKLTTDSLTNVGHKADAVGLEFLKIKLTDVIISSFAKIDQQLGAFGDGSVDKLIPAVQRLQDATNTYTGSLNSLPSLEPKLLDGFLKIQNDLLKVDVVMASAAKLSDFHFTHPIDKASARLLLKLDTTFQKIDSEIIAVFGNTNDALAIKGEVDTLKVETENVLIGLLNPAPIGTPTTALTTTSTSDTIS